MKLKQFHWKIFRITLLILMCITLCSCASDQILLAQGKQNFIVGDYHQAFKTLQPLAVKGNADAQYAVGYMYFYGYGTPKNNQLANKWMQSAAAQGQPGALQALKMIQDQMLNDNTTTNPTFTSVPPDYQTDINNAMSNPNQ
ncbi:MAG: tetratricopeptide repeat protein [Gammaproteobacteria bacterium]